VLAALTLGLAACGNDGGARQSSAPKATSATTAPTTTEATAPSAVSTSDLAVADSPLGPIVTDRAGRTVYVFTKDTTPGASACSGQCAATWPALKPSGDAPQAGSGIAAKLGTITRTDGKRQLTLAGMPLYYFTPDGETAGATRGQGIGGVWFVVGPDGAVNRKAPS
jgi:predicted lipoprotein with Yx(FWY)xxD motif